MDDGAPLAALALGLRELRHSASSPSYRDMGKRVHRSQTTLSEAAGGRAVPTWETVEAYVRACEGSPELWRERWEAAASRASLVEAASQAAAQTTAQAASQAQAVAVAVATPDPAEAHRELLGAPPARSVGRPPWRLRVAVGTAAVLAAGVVGILVPWHGEPAAPVAPTAAQQVTQVVRDGSDPEDTGCARLPGVTVLDDTEVDYDGQPTGVVQLKYSPQCGAAWPRFQPNQVTNLPAHTTVHVDVVRPDGQEVRFPFDAQFVGEVIFGNLALSTSKCVYAAVWIEDHGKRLPQSRTHCFRGATYVR